MIVFATVTTPDLFAVVVDLNTGERWNVPARPDLVAAGDRWRPFGVAFDDAALFASNESTCVVFDRTTLDVVDIVRDVWFPNVHTIERTPAGELVGVCCWANCLVVVDRDWSPFYVDLINGGFLPDRPTPDQVGRAFDRHHFNAAAFDQVGRRWFVLAHNRGPSFVRVFDGESFHQVDDDLAIEADQAHGLAYRDGELWTLDTGGRRDLVSTSGERIATGIESGRFCRGWSWTGDDLVVAHFPPAQRAVGRGRGDAVLEWHNGDQVERFDLVGTGAINELRTLDVPDLVNEHSIERAAFRPGRSLALWGNCKR